MAIKGYLILAVVLTVLITSCCILKNVRQILHPKPPRPPRREEFNVSQCPTGASIVCTAGRRDRKTATVTLYGISSPAEGESLADESAASLKTLAGGKIAVEFSRRRILLTEGADENVSVERDKWLKQQEEAARHDCVGVVYGESGICCNLEQLHRG